MSIIPKHPSFAAAQAKHVLVLDDDASILTVLSRSLSKEGYRVSVVASVEEATRMLAKEWVDIIITDVTMPGGNGLAALKEWRARAYTMPVIVMSAHNLLLHAAQAQELGATEFLSKPFDLSALHASITRALEGKPASRQIDDSGVLTIAPGTVLVGKSNAMQEVYRTLVGLISNDVTVMILGESGTGKELVARALHLLGARKAKPFVALNMAAIPHDLVESALFGHEKGAFTGAYQRKSGAFEQAQGGTLFLDEIGDMPMAAQTRLLRVLQEGTFSTVGGNRYMQSDVRIVTATHQDLRKLITQGKFREDLFYRLHVVPVSLPPLRARAEDIPVLAEHFLEEARAQGLPHKSLDTSAMLALMHHTWPGNVRELKHTIVRMCTTVPRAAITAGDVAQMLAPTQAPVNDITAAAPLSAPTTMPHEALRVLEIRLKKELTALLPKLPADATLYDTLMPIFERPLIELALDASATSQVKAAAKLGINRNTLRTKLKQLGIK